MNPDDEPTNVGPGGRPPDEEETDVRPASGPPDPRTTAIGVAVGPGQVPSAGPGQPTLIASSQPAAPGQAVAGAGQPGPGGGGDGGGNGNGDTIGRAVLVGVRDAGVPVARFLDIVGGHLILVARALAWLPRRPFRMKNYLEAAEYIGWGSLPIVLLVGAFTGMVLSLQSVYAFRQLGFESFSGAATAKALSIELAPVLTSLMLAGRVGAGIATELGTMRISEQIDALESMAVNPVQYLILPRLIAAMIVAPILTLLFFIVGMGGGYLVAVVIEGVAAGQWVAKLRDLVGPTDVLQGLIKSVFFGFLVALIGCYQGFHATGGGRGVGIGTTRAVVMGSVTTLVLDYFLTDILLSIFGTGKGAS